MKLIQNLIGVLGLAMAFVLCLFAILWSISLFEAWYDLPLVLASLVVPVMVLRIIVDALREID